MALFRNDKQEHKRNTDVDPSEPLSRDTFSSILRDILKFYSAPLVRKARERNYAKIRNEESNFWLGRPAMWMYTDFVIALILRRAWVLYGAMLIVFAQISWFALLWIVHFMDDPRLWDVIAYLNCWADVWITQGEMIIYGKEGVQSVVAGWFLVGVPSTINVIKVIARKSMEALNAETLRGMDRRFHGIQSRLQTSLKSIAKEVRPTSIFQPDGS